MSTNIESVLQDFKSKLEELALRLKQPIFDENNNCNEEKNNSSILPITREQAAIELSHHASHYISLLVNNCKNNKNECNNTPQIQDVSLLETSQFNGYKHCNQINNKFKHDTNNNNHNFNDDSDDDNTNHNDIYNNDNGNYRHHSKQSRKKHTYQDDNKNHKKSNRCQNDNNDNNDNNNKHDFVKKRKGYSKTILTCSANCGACCSQFFSAFIRQCNFCSCFILLSILSMSLLALIMLNIHEVRYILVEFNNYKKMHVEQIKYEKEQLTFQKELDYKLNVDLEKIQQEHLHEEKMAMIQAREDITNKFIESNTRITTVNTWHLLSSEVITTRQTLFSEEDIAIFQRYIIDYSLGDKNIYEQIDDKPNNVKKENNLTNNVDNIHDDANDDVHDNVQDNDNDNDNVNNRHDI